MAGQCPERSDFYPRRGYGESQIAVPRMLWCVAVGPDQAEGHVRFLGGAGPDRLAVDDEFVAFDPGAGLETGEVRSRSGFGIALAPHHTARERRFDPAPLLLFGAKLEQGDRKSTRLNSSH